MLNMLIHWYVLCINASASNYSDELGKDSSLGKNEFSENPFGRFLCLISDLNLLKIGFFKSQMTYDCFHEIHQKVEVGFIDEKISQEYLLNLIYSKKEIKNILIRPSLLIHKFCSENRNQKTDGIYKQLRNILNEVIKDYSNMLANLKGIEVDRTKIFDTVKLLFQMNNEFTFSCISIKNLIQLLNAEFFLRFDNVSKLIQNKEVNEMYSKYLYNYVVRYGNRVKKLFDKHNIQIETAQDQILRLDAPDIYEILYHYFKMDVLKCRTQGFKNQRDLLKVHEDTLLNFIDSLFLSPKEILKRMNIDNLFDFVSQFSILEHFSHINVFDLEIFTFENGRIVLKSKEDILQSVFSTLNHKYDDIFDEEKENKIITDKTMKNDPCMLNFYFYSLSLECFCDYSFLNTIFSEIFEILENKLENKNKLGFIAEMKNEIHSITENRYFEEMKQGIGLCFLEELN